MASLAAITGCLLGCQEQTAIQVDFRAEGPGDQLCIVAYAGDEVVFSETYSSSEVGSPPSGSLTFLSGDRTNNAFRITGRLDRGGVVLASGSNELEFADGNVQRRALDVARCHPRAERLGEPLPTELLVVSDLELAAGMITSDIDGDGRDEVLFLSERGSMLRVDADAPELLWLDPLVPMDSAITTTADLDRNCELDVISRMTGEVWAARNPLNGKQTLRLVKPSVNDTVVGGIGGVQHAALYTVSAQGVEAYEPDTDRSYVIDDYAATHVHVVDFTEDGLDDVLASGASGTLAFVGATSYPQNAADALPATFTGVKGPIAHGDFDGDGHMDLAGATDAGIVIARNDGTGTMVDAGALPELDAMAQRLLSADVDGDCRDDVIAMDGAGALYVWRTETPLAFVRVLVSIGTLREIAIGDLNGDGAKELVMLTHSYGLSAWGL